MDWTEAILKAAAKREFDALVHAYDSAIIYGDAIQVREALARSLPAALLEAPDLHAELRRRRGNAYTRIGQPSYAEGEYAAGFPHAPVEMQGDYLLDWAMAPFSRMFIDGSGEEKRSACRRCLHVLGAAEDLATRMKDPAYLLASTHCIRAFVLTYLGDRQGAIEELVQVRGDPHPPALQHDPALYAYWTQLPKGLCAALESRERELITRISSAALLEPEWEFLSGRNPSPGATLVSAVAWRSDTPKFRDAWWYGIELAEHLSPAFPLLSQFRSRVAEGGQPADLARYVDDICNA